VNRIEPWEQEELFKRKRIDDLNFWKKEISKRKYNPSAIAHRHSGVGECKSCMHVENRESRSPDLIGAVNRWRDRWHEIPRIRGSAFRRLQSRKEHGEIARARVATGPTEIVWSITRGIGTSVLGVPKYKGSASRVAISRGIDR
jgi:hypothetical protein